ncbi:MAG: 50S ribosomal protein L11 methyltransferase [Thermodesulfobacteriota bacterium]|nr:50S ribosomal protein L11 methyltransferase [Thermodesulfobacteriota bacterium]
MRILHEVKIITRSETAKVLDELFPSVGLFPSSLYPIKSENAEISFYEETALKAKELKRFIEQCLKGWCSIANFDKSIVVMQRIKAENWAESWKRFFKPQKVSTHIVVKPSWEIYQSLQDEIIVEIDPGMSFGTGIHPTTKGCIQFLDALSSKKRGGSFIDMGCGSGILSIVAAKLGFRPVVAFDHDADALTVAAENITRAMLDSEVELFQHALEDFIGTSTYFDIGAVNIAAPILMENTHTVTSVLKRGSFSRLIISGILNEQYSDVLESFKGVQLEELEHIVIGEWTTGLLRWKM